MTKGGGNGSLRTKPHMPGGFTGGSSSSHGAEAQSPHRGPEASFLGLPMAPSRCALLGSPPCACTPGSPCPNSPFKGHRSYCTRGHPNGLILP